jgi:hypothetical protein
MRNTVLEGKKRPSTMVMKEKGMPFKYCYNLSDSARQSEKQCVCSARDRPSVVRLQWPLVRSVCARRNSVMVCLRAELIATEAGFIESLPSPELLRCR